MVESTHQEPVWRDRANFIIGARLPESGRTEQLWARQIEAQRFELCCIPFFAYDLALGDIVETDAEHNVIRVAEPAGRYVFRVWFGESPERRQEVAAVLSSRGCLLEWSSGNLLAVDAADRRQAESVAGLLADAEKEGALHFETGRS